MLPGTLTGLRGSFSLRLASTCNHRPDKIILNHYTRKIEKKQAIFRNFFMLILDHFALFSHESS